MNKLFLTMQVQLKVFLSAYNQYSFRKKREAKEIIITEIEKKI